MAPGCIPNYPTVSRVIVNCSGKKINIKIVYQSNYLAYVVVTNEV